jgi:hypothetical protein
MTQPDIGTDPYRPDAEWHTCSTCGYRWLTGMHGGHDCTAAMKAQLAAITAERDELARKLAEAEAKFEKVRKSVAWHRDGKGPDVPVLQPRYDALQQRADAAEATLRTCCDNEEAARLTAAKLIGDKAQGDSYSVPSVADLMEMVVNRADAAEAKVRELEAITEYVRGVHNGYDPSAREAMPSLAEPASTLDAIRQLVEEGIDLADDANKIYATTLEQQLSQLQAKLAAVREAAETLLFAIDQWRKGAYRVEGCQLAERNLKAAIAATVKE